MNNHALSSGICLVETGRHHFDMQKIDNRRFMFNPATGSLIFGKDGKTDGSHAEEFSHTGCGEGFDNFIRGWVGTGKNYPSGIIHFAPNIPAECIGLFDRAFDTLLMFKGNGAVGKTIVRGFGRVWEQMLCEIAA